MRRRHPHLFELGDAEPWEHIKRRERKGHVLGGLIPTLPSLLMAYRLQERAASVGFDWPGVEGPLDKVREELDEVEEELRSVTSPSAAPRDADPNAPGLAPSQQLVDEVGDLCSRWSIWRGRQGFRPVWRWISQSQVSSRFEGIERLAAERGIDVQSAGLTSWMDCGTR